MAVASLIMVIAPIDVIRAIVAVVAVCVFPERRIARQAKLALERAGPTEKQLRAFNAKRDLAAELLESVQQMKAGKTHVVLSPAIEARERKGLSQSQFAMLLGDSVRTLQGWEQDRKQPSGAARTLLTIARTNPKALLAVGGK